MAVLVHSAAIQDRDGGRLLMEPLLGDPLQRASSRLPRLEKMWADTAYAGAFEDALLDYEVDVEIVSRSNDTARQMWVGPGEEPTARVAGFHLQAHRWIVERTIAWLSRFRRLARDYELYTHNSEAWIAVASIRLMLARIVAT